MVKYLAQGHKCYDQHSNRHSADQTPELESATELSKSLPKFLNILALKDHRFFSEPTLLRRHFHLVLLQTSLSLVNFFMFDQNLFFSVCVIYRLACEKCYVTDASKYGYERHMYRPDIKHLCFGGWLVCKLGSVSTPKIEVSMSVSSVRLCLFVCLFVLFVCLFVCLDDPLIKGTLKTPTRGYKHPAGNSQSLSYEHWLSVYDYELHKSRNFDSVTSGNTDSDQCGISGKLGRIRTHNLVIASPAVQPLDHS